MYKRVLILLRILVGFRVDAHDRMMLDNFGDHDAAQVPRIKRLVRGV